MGKYRVRSSEIFFKPEAVYAAVSDKGGSGGGYIRFINKGKRYLSYQSYIAPRVSKIIPATTSPWLGKFDDGSQNILSKRKPRYYMHEHVFSHVGRPRHSVPSLHGNSNDYSYALLNRRKNRYYQHTFVFGTEITHYLLKQDGLHNLWMGKEHGWQKRRRKLKAKQYSIYPNFFMMINDLGVGWHVTRSYGDTMVGITEKTWTVQ